MYGLIRCPVCRRAPSSYSGLCKGCADGLFEPQIGEFELSLGNYGGRLEQAVRAYKFHGTRQLGGLFGRQLAATLGQAAWPVDTLCAVPLHVTRYLHRGYNQSALVAQSAATRAALPYRSLLRRVRTTKQQAKLGGAAREDNVSGAFSSQRLSGERVLLVDDVMTSGATVTECALTLLEAGASQVYVAAIARAAPSQPAAS